MTSELRWNFRCTQCGELGVYWEDELGKLGSVGLRRQTHRLDRVGNCLSCLLQATVRDNSATYLASEIRVPFVTRQNNIRSIKRSTINRTTLTADCNTAERSNFNRVAKGKPGFGRVTYLRVNVGGPAEQNSEILSRANVYGNLFARGPLFGFEK